LTSPAGVEADPGLLEEAPARANHLGPVRPSLLSVWPSEDGYFGIDVRWQGRECVLRALVVRRLLADAGLYAHAGHSQDGRMWELKIGRVPGDRVGRVIETIIW
jgi:hypothetical protein